MSKQVIKCVFQVRTLEARFHCNMNIEKSKVNRPVNRHISKKPVWEQLVSNVSDLWTRYDADTCPRLDTCPYPNRSRSRTQPTLQSNQLRILRREVPINQN